MNASLTYAETEAALENEYNALISAHKAREDSNQECNRLLTQSRLILEAAAWDEATEEDVAAAERALAEAQGRNRLAWQRWEQASRALDARRCEIGFPLID